MVSATDTHTGQVARAYTLAQGDTFREYFENIKAGNFYLVARDLAAEMLTSETLAWLDAAFWNSGHDFGMGKRLITGIGRIDQGVRVVLRGELKHRPRLRTLIWGRITWCPSPGFRRSSTFRPNGPPAAGWSARCAWQERLLDRRPRLSLAAAGFGVGSSRRAGRETERRRSGPDRGPSQVVAQGRAHARSVPARCRARPCRQAVDAPGEGPGKPRKDAASRGTGFGPRQLTNSGYTSERSSTRPVLSPMRSTGTPSWLSTVR